MRLRSPFRTPEPDVERYGLGDYMNWVQQLTVHGNTYSLPVDTTMPGQKAEAIGNNFEGYVRGGLFANPIVFALETRRVQLFAGIRFQYRNLTSRKLFGDASLAPLEAPWPGGTTQDLLARQLLHADFAGNAYLAALDGELVFLRPDWVDIVLERRNTRAGVVGMRKAGYLYYEGGRAQNPEPVVFLADEVSHFAPNPDPLATYRGMSWLTPVLREIQADQSASEHKLRFFENAATPNLAVSLKEITDPKVFQAFIDAMDESHRGVENAYKTLYLGAGADVTVVGADLRQIDFSVTQGKGETRIAAASGVGPVVAMLSEGLQGSSLNAGNFGQARRLVADSLLHPLWMNVTGSLAPIIDVPGGSELWYDTRSVPFLREDEKDAAEILNTQATAVNTFITAGYDPDSAAAAVAAGDLSLLKHTGMVSVQLQKPGSEQSPPGDAAPVVPPAVPAA